MLYTGITLPKVGNLDSEAERKRIISALYEIDEKLRLVLNNLDLDNFSSDLETQLIALEQSMESLGDPAQVQSSINSMRGNLNNMGVDLQSVIEVNNQQATDISSNSAAIQLAATSLTNLDGTVNGEGGLTERVSAQETLTSTYTQTADNVSILMGKTTEIESDTETIKEQLSTSFTFETNGLRIGKSTSEISTLYDNDGMKIQDSNGTNLAVFASDGTIIEKVQTNSINLAYNNINGFELVSDANGFSIRKV